MEKIQKQNCDTQEIEESKGNLCNWGSEVHLIYAILRFEEGQCQMGHIWQIFWKGIKMD